nr:AlpA family transcriptional regulator [uncultured Amphritea sp.]
MMTIRFLRRPEVEKTTGLSRSTIYLRMEKGTFPKPIPLGGRLVGWKESDIQQWVEDRIKESEQAA